jgi:two-component system, chemotaxis family, chemotaxis protein CheY
LQKSVGVKRFAREKQRAHACFIAFIAFPLDVFCNLKVYNVFVIRKCLSLKQVGNMKDFSCLVVEDSPMMRQLIIFALTRIKNIAVTEVGDGVMALKQLANARFDLVITDINMPIMDGLKLVQRIRADKIHKDVPIIIITTEGSNEDKQRAMALGASTYITKPIQAPHVISKVKELLNIE